MIQSETKKVMKEVEEVVRAVVTCDVCGEKTPIVKNLFGQVYQKYYSVSVWHNDWGNDSVDSNASYQACSYQCALKLGEKWFEENEGSDTASCEIETYTRTYKE